MQSRGAALFLLIILILGAGLRLSSLHGPGFFEPDNFYYYSSLSQAHGLALPSVSAYDGVKPAESYGIYYLTLIPYWLFGGYASMYSIMSLLPVFLWIVEALLVLWLAMLVIKDYRYALLCCLLLALSIANMTKTMALTYRGDGFVSVFLLAGLIVYLYIFNSDLGKRNGLAFAFISGIVLSLTSLVWSGGVYAFVVFYIGSLGIMAWRWLNGRRALHEYFYPFLASLGWVISIGAYQAMGWVGSLVFIQPYLPLFLGLELAAGLIMYLSRHLGGDVGVEALTLVAFVSIGLVLAYFIHVPSLSSFISPGGNQYAIIELAKPTLFYYFGSYTFAFLLSPAIGFLFNWWPALGIGIALLFAFTLLALRRFEGMEGGIMLMSWLGITMFLDMQYTRFNELASIAVVMWFAYVLFLFLENINRRAFLLKFVGYSAILLIVVFSAFYAFEFAGSWQPANGSGTGLLSAMVWLGGHTPANSTVLTQWTDGSVVEGWAHRRVYSDSVAIQNNWITTDRWFYSTNGSLAGFSPAVDYVLVRHFWINETIGTCQQLYNDSANCSLTLIDNGTQTNMSYLELRHPNFYVLLTSCHSVGCNVSIGQQGFELVFVNNDSLIYRAIR